MSMPPPPPPSDPFPQPPGYQPYPAGAPMPMKQGKSGLAVASLVCSLVGLIPCFWLIQIPALLGAIFGIIGLKQTKSGERGGRGLAMAGMIIGIILVVACAIFWIYFATNAECVRTGSSFDCTVD
jgi:Na+/proline symporter